MPHELDACVTPAVHHEEIAQRPPLGDAPPSASRLHGLTKRTRFGKLHGKALGRISSNGTSTRAADR